MNNKEHKPSPLESSADAAGEWSVDAAMADRADGFFRDASELGLAPGNFPVTLSIFNIAFTRARIIRDFDGDVTEAVYVDARGNTLTVIND